jgi:hypothetical protein
MLEGARAGERRELGALGFAESELELPGGYHAA